MKKIILFMLILLVLITGCSKKKVGSDDKVKSNYVKVVPSKLFQGDTKRLEPHMDMTTGCVNIKYKGIKKSMGLKYEIWKDGILETKGNLASQYIQNNEFDGELSISLKDIVGDNLEISESMIVKTVFREKSGYSSSTTYIDRFDKDYGYSPEELQNEIDITDDKDIVIWGLTANNNGNFSGGEEIEDKVKKSNWGLVLKLYFN